MIIFKEHLKRLFSSRSTVIILAVGLTIILASLKGTLEFFTPNEYFTSSIVIFPILNVFFFYYQVFLWFVFPVFVATNAIKFVADEVEDGTFLTILSKPVSRARILIERFLANQIANFLFALSFLGLIWFFAINKYPVYELSKVMLKTLPSTILVTILIQLFLSIFLVFISLKLKPSAIMTIGTSIAIFAQLAPRMFTSNITKNRKVQRLGLQVDFKEYNEVNKGQKLYKQFFRPFMYFDHMSEIYWETIADQYKEYKLEKTIYDFASSSTYLREAKFKTVEVDSKNLNNEEIKETRYVVSDLQPWVDPFRIKIYYAIGSILLMLFGFIYFSRKDIV